MANCKEVKKKMKAYRHKVQYYETDRMGIVHHSNYIRWMEEARTDFLEQVGWPYDKMEEAGIISPVTSVECKYKVTTTFADIVDIQVRVEEFKGVKLKLKYEMKKGEVVVCEGHSEHCFLDVNGKPIRVKKEHPAFYETMLSLVEKEA